jgi:hypothetical protein
MPRDLDAEFDSVSRQFKTAAVGQRRELAETFAKLFIDTLKEEKDRTRWTDIAQKFPLNIRELAMAGDQRKSFLRKLGIKAATADRWLAKVRLDMRIRHFQRAKSDRERKAAQEEMDACKGVCVELMVKLVKEENPTTIPELRATLDSAYDYEMQEMFLPVIRTRLDKEKISILNKRDDATLFNAGVRVGLLHDRFMTHPSLQTSLAYHASVAEQSKNLAIALFKSRSLVDMLASDLSGTTLQNHHPLVLYHLLGERQHLLYTTLNAEIGLEEFTRIWEAPLVDFTPIVEDSMPAVVPKRVQFLDLRKRASELKEQFDPETDITRLLKLFKGLWRMGVLRQHVKKERHARLLAHGATIVMRPIARRTLWFKVASRDWRRELPIRIIDAVIQGGPEDLDTRLVDTLHQLPLKVTLNTLKMYKNNIISTTQVDRMPAVIKAFKFFQTTYG